MSDQLEKMGLDYEVIEAVNGHALTQEQIETMCNMDRIREWSSLMTPGMIGCSLSHYKVYCEMVERSIPEALILEDDTQLHSHLPKVLRDIQRGFVSKTI